MRSDRGTVLTGVLIVAAILTLTGLLYWGALWLQVRAIVVALTAIGFFGAGLLVPVVIAFVVGLVRKEAPSEPSRVWHAFILLFPLTVAAAETWWFWSAPRSPGAVAIWAQAGSLVVVLAGWALVAYVKEKRSA